MRLRRALAFVFVVLLYLQPATAYAYAYSTVQYEAKLWPPGYNPPATSACLQAGVVDTARNYSYAQERDWVDQSCSGSPHNVGVGYLGTQVYGYKNGSLCGHSNWYYNTQTTYGQQLWVTLCDNPPALQDFESISYGSFYDCCGLDWRDFQGPAALEWY